MSLLNKALVCVSASCRRQQKQTASFFKEAVTTLKPNPSRQLDCKLQLWDQLSLAELFPEFPKRIAGPGKNYQSTAHVRVQTQFGYVPIL